MFFLTAVRTDPGSREINQDSCCVCEAETADGPLLFAALADGLGGLEKGEAASAAVICRFADWFAHKLPETAAVGEAGKRKDAPAKSCAEGRKAADCRASAVRGQWDRLVREENLLLNAYGKREGIRTGTTLTALLIREDGRFLIGHIGDCRVYRLRGGEITRLTEDQTEAAALVRRKVLRPEEVEMDPRQSVLLQCIGGGGGAEAVYTEGNAAPGDVFLLCSDGFRRKMTEEELKKAFSGVPKDEEAMRERLKAVTEKAKARQETDNLTAVLIRVL